MPFTDLREFINQLQKEGETVIFEEEVDWDLEAGAMVRRCNEEGLPAPFFNKIKDYPDGFRLFGSPLGSIKRLALAMELQSDIHPKDVIKAYIDKRQKSIKPVLVKDAPCKENILLGDDVDLMHFPIPLVHEGDGGRYVGTFHVDIVEDPDTNWVNWSMQRHMVQSANTMSIVAHPYSHLGMIYQNGYEKAGNSMDVAVAIGVEPVSAFCSAIRFPDGVSEVDKAGAIRGEPVELVKCETSNLAVPATAEIVVEGEIRPNERQDDGPFGEFTGYLGGIETQMPLITVKAITYRNDPILTMSCEGIPPGDSHTIKSIAGSADIYESLRSKGLPVVGAYIIPEGTGMCTVVAVKPSIAHIAEQIAHEVWATKPGRISPYIIIVDDDVDPFNLQQVFHAMISKCHPFRGITRIERATGMIFYPWADEHERKYRIGGKAYFDCTWPRTWDPSEIPKRCSFEDAYPAEIRQKALAKWRKYGY